MTTALALTRPQKAAAILVAMGKPSASRLLKFFKQEELRALVDAARMLRTIPQSELERIVAEFEAEFTEGAGLLDSADTMERMLNESLSPEEMNALMGVETEQEADAPPPIWPDVEKLESARLGAFLAGEHPQTAAVVLSKLAPQAAANVLLTLEKSSRGEIIKRMMTMANVPDSAVRIVEDQIRARLLVENAVKDMSAGQARVANVLNELEKDKLEEMMRDLEASGASDLDGIRARLFAFEDILLLTQKARVTLFDGISTELVTLALRGAEPAMTESVLSSIGARSRRMIEAELATDIGNISSDDISRARKSIASAAIRLAGEGAFELPSTQKQDAAA
ncbi:flagellar motor switch protein FliG [Mesorhizobium sp. BAC0120]|uniref:flagellar motor switch protein FliG n=1 Tax=Mesorhizobium sp. BAC0120 TaxID=3090670 RepID=UPI00298CE5EB|nr:flagellar motor switch protein FliG [Mesorhizobium sp. BAC0120]MDW6024454.1 flagellar motor switch protein FliG [Mesorhizobium sp. BAC0120]